MKILWHQFVFDNVKYSETKNKKNKKNFEGVIDIVYPFNLNVKWIINYRTLVGFKREAIVSEHLRGNSAVRLRGQISELHYKARANFFACGTLAKHQIKRIISILTRVK